MSQPLTQFMKITSSGKFIDYENPTVDAIDTGTIANELSLINRWNGNLHFPYSVVQHSLLVAQLIPVPEWRIYGLLHDAAEAYIGDINTPLKKFIQMGGGAGEGSTRADGGNTKNNGTDIMGLERQILNCIWEHFDLPKPTAEIAKAVHLADQVALATEYRDVVMGTSPRWTPTAKPHNRALKFMPPAEAQCQFLAAIDDYLLIFRASQNQIKGVA